MSTSQSSKTPQSPLLLNSFNKLWREYFPGLKLSAGGSGFCDSCHCLSTALKTVNKLDKTQLERTLLIHKEEATLSTGIIETQYKNVKQNKFKTVSHCI